jgi:Fe-S cluster assembly protein SufD
MDAVVKINAVERTLADQFGQAAPALPGGAAVAGIRARAFEAFERQGLPHRRVEEWKYTDLRALIHEAHAPAAAPDKTALQRAARALKAHGLKDTRKLVLVDGLFQPEMSDLARLEGGLTIEPLGAALARDPSLLQAGAADDANPVLALNTALTRDGFVIALADGASLSRPVHIVHVMSSAVPASAYTRSLVRVGAKASLTLVESFVSATDAPYQINDSVFVTVGAGARLDHVRLMEDRGDAFNLSAFQVELSKEAALNTFNLTSGAAVSRYDLSLKFVGESARAETFGVNLLRASQHGDSTLVVDHAVPGCMSRETFRSVLDDKARSVFQGRIIVRPDAQKTDGKMMTRALLLSEDAEADHKPELEIFADDVTCGHGAVSGALDEDLLFYLRARGLPEQEAQALLIQAFVGEAIEAIVDEKLREAAIATADRWLKERVR